MEHTLDTRWLSRRCSQTDCVFARSSGGRRGVCEFGGRALLRRPYMVGRIRSGTVYCRDGPATLTGTAIDSVADRGLHCHRRLFGFKRRLLCVKALSGRELSPSSPRLFTVACRDIAVRAYAKRNREFTSQCCSSEGAHQTGGGVGELGFSRALERDFGADMTRSPNKSPEPTPVGAGSSASRFTSRVGGGSAFFVRPL